MRETSEELLQTTIRHIESDQRWGENDLLAIHAAIQHLVQVMHVLQTQLATYQFPTEEEEIYFFKNVKPQFDGLLIYYQKLLRIEEKSSEGTLRERSRYYEREMKRLSVFFEINIEFYRYYRLNAQYLDRAYFLRSAVAENYILDDNCPIALDRQFFTRMSYKLGLILAYQKLQAHIEIKLKLLDSESVKPSTNFKLLQKAKNDDSLTWTHSKAALAELIVALHEYGVFNNTKLQLKMVSDAISSAFNTNVGNIYKVYEDNRLKKKNRTPFLDALKASYLRRLEHDDEYA